MNDALNFVLNILSDSTLSVFLSYDCLWSIGSIYYLFLITMLALLTCWAHSSFIAWAWAWTRVWFSITISFNLCLGHCSNFVSSYWVNVHIFLFSFSAAIDSSFSVSFFLWNELSVHRFLYYFLIIKMETANLYINHMNIKNWQIYSLKYYW